MYRVEVPHRSHLDQAQLGLWQPRGDLDGAVKALAVEQEEAGQQLLGLGVGAVAGDHLAVTDRHPGRQRRVGEGLGDDQLARRGQLLAEGGVPAEPFRALVIGDPSQISRDAGLL